MVIMAKMTKFNILSIFECYRKLFPLVYIRYNLDGIEIQAKDKKLTVTAVIPKESFNTYEYSFVDPTSTVMVPTEVAKIGGKCTEMVIYRQLET